MWIVYTVNWNIQDGCTKVFCWNFFIIKLFSNNSALICFIIQSVYNFDRLFINVIDFNKVFFLIHD